jgi:chemotaxis protein methyltransferase CheR
VFPHEVLARRVIDVAAQPHVGSTQRETPWPEAEGPFLEWLFAQAGLAARDYRSETLMRRLPSCLRLLQASSLTEARSVLKNRPELIAAAINVLLIGVTSFFRDPAVFEDLAQTHLGALAIPRRGIYAWSAGCSDGAELYSLAMLLEEQGLLKRSYLLGTDCRADAILHAQAGAYEETALAGVSPQRREKFFTREGTRWQIAPRLQHVARWRQGDLLSQSEPGLWDLIFCRNTSIYLRSTAACQLWQRLENALRVGGLLVLGKAERPASAKRLSCIAPCIYQKTRK